MPDGSPADLGVYVAARLSGAHLNPAVTLVGGGLFKVLIDRNLTEEPRGDTAVGAPVPARPPPHITSRPHSGTPSTEER